MKIIRFISKLIIGIVFAFSGFVKCIDPLGTAYKISDYLIEFNLLGLTKFALAVSIIMCGLELLIGLMLIFNVKVNWGAWLALIFMVFYTPLTLYIALFNPVTDCGCFGDALILSNWATFWKNLVLIVLAIIVFLYRKEFRELFNPILRYVAIGLLMLIVFGFEWYSVNHLPIIDFRPYKIGVNIQESMEMPPDAPQDVIESIFIYEKEGMKVEFTIDNLPNTDDGWVFVDRKDKLISKGYEPPIHDFSIATRSGWEITDEVLNGGYVGLIVAYDLNTTSVENQKEINVLANFMIETGHQFICLTASTNETIDEFAAKHNVPYEFYITDPITLKTVIRANPGLVLIKNGTILNKWHHQHLPSMQELDKEIQVIEY